MPPAERPQRSNAASSPPAAPQLKVVTAPILPPHRAESIATLTAKARSLHNERVENEAKIDSLQFRNSAIRRELEAITKQVTEHAWDGQPLPTS